MRVRAKVGALVLATLVFVNEVKSQSAKSEDNQRDPQAVAILVKCIRAGGGESAFSKIKDFSASGTIIHHWGGAEVKGKATMQGRGTDEFRMDSNLSQGTRSTIVGREKSAISDLGGKSREVPYHNSINMGALTFPFLPLFEALKDPSTSILFLGPVALEGREVYQIRISRSFAAQGDKEGILSKLATKDFFIDSASFLPISAKWMTHPPDDYSQNIPQQMLFADFRAINGVMVPFVITETIYGQRTWDFQVETMKLNSELSERAFEYSPSR